MTNLQALRILVNESWPNRTEYAQAVLHIATVVHQANDSADVKLVPIRKRGKVAKPTNCPRCGAECASARLAKAHCAVR